MGFLDLFQKVSQIPAGIGKLIKSKSQKGLVYDTSEWIDRMAIMFQGVPLPWNWKQNENYYQQSAVFQAAVNAIVNLCISQIDFTSDTDEEDVDRAKKWNSKIRIEQHLATLLTQMLIHGYSVAEICGDGETLETSSEILKLEPLYSPSIRFRVDRYGNLIELLQHKYFLKQFILTEPFYPIQLDPKNCLIFIRKPKLFTVYGVPLSVGAENEIKAIDAISSLSSINASSLAAPVHVHTLKPQEATGWGPADWKKEMENNMSNWQDAKGGDHIGNYGEWIDTVYKPSEGIYPVQKELEWFSSVLAGKCGIDTNSIGLNTSKSLHQSEVVNTITRNNCRTLQRNVIEELGKLYEWYAEIYKTNAIYPSMDAITLEDSKSAAERESIVINNIERKLRLGFLSPEVAAAEVGGVVYDEKRLQKQLDKEDEPENPQDGKGDRNQAQRMEAENERPTEGTN